MFYHDKYLNIGNLDSLCQAQKWLKPTASFSTIEANSMFAIADLQITEIGPMPLIV